MRFTVITAAIFLVIASSYSADAALEHSASRDPISIAGVSGILNKAEKRSFTSRSRAFTRENHQRRNGSLLPNIVLPSITPSQPAPVAAPPVSQAVPYTAAQGYYLPQAPNYPVAQPATQPATQPVANFPSSQTASYPPQQAVNYSPQPPIQNYTPPQPNIALPTLVQAPAKNKKEEDDDEDEEEEDEDEEDEEDYDADDLVTRRRR
ncbi:hypothetical protein [Parasitella parasitica]|uniref:Uncharacterized protein n=1 Tax=Parasitella parasitica TaxID=35722 RepID=A0A0B7MYL9_9FUNG|nr:hypothetical protein [Parasitella parasitica]